MSRFGISNRKNGIDISNFGEGGDPYSVYSSKMRGNSEQSLKSILNDISLQEFLINDATLGRDEEKDMLWFHRKITREIAVHILHENGAHQGLFLIRESTTRVGDYVISLMHNNQPAHFQIQCVGDFYFRIEKGPVFQGLEKLVNYYRKKADGLPTQLMSFCPGEPPPSAARRVGRTTPLHRAAMENESRIMSQMLNQDDTLRGHIDARNANGQTALHEASANGFIDIINKLLENGANINSKNSSGVTALYVACACQKAESCRVLMQAGADPTQRHPNTGWVPLHEVATKGYSKCASILVKGGAPCHPRNTDDETPLDLARRYGHADVTHVIKTFKPSVPPRVPLSSCYHGVLDRKQALERIQNVGIHDGVFLIRTSPHKPDVYILTMAANGGVFNFEIQKKSESLFIDDGPYFSSMEFLIEHYMRYEDGLPTRLNQVVHPEKNYLFQSQSPPANRTIHKNPPPDPSKPSSPRRHHTSGATKPPPIKHPGAVPTAVVQHTSGGNKPPPIKYPGAVPTAVVGNRGSLPSRDCPLPPQRQSSGADTPVPASPVPLSPTPSPPAPSGLSRLFSSKKHTDRKEMERQKRELQRAIQSAPGREVTTEDVQCIDSKHITKGREIGQGEFGSVLEGIWKDPKGSKIKVAIKTLHTDHLHTGQQDEFLREAKVMCGLKHLCIVRLIGISLGPPMMLVQELVPMGSLLEFLLNRADDIIPRDLKLWAAQITSGMMYLEDMKFVHRDLAARNILLESKEQAKISDFGLSRATGANNDYYRATTGGRWPVKWYAPESIYYGTFSHASDVWSFGVTLWEMYTYGDQPYGELTGAEVIKRLENGIRLDKPKDATEMEYKIMRKCWSYKPDERPTFLQLNQLFSEDPEYQEFYHAGRGQAPSIRKR